MIRGQKYVFNLESSVSGHPFVFQTTDNGGAYDAPNVYTNGITNAGADSGTIEFIVPYDAPGTLYFRCHISYFILHIPDFRFHNSYFICQIS